MGYFSVKQREVSLVADSGCCARELCRSLVFSVAVVLAGADAWGCCHAAGGLALSTGSSCPGPVCCSKKLAVWFGGGVCAKTMDVMVLF